MRRRRILVTGAASVAVAAITALQPLSGAAPAPANQGAATVRVTYADHIAPLIFEHCGVCHRPDGAAPFSLLTYPAVRQRATQIAAVTRTRFMPPWKAEPGYGEFVGQDPLSPEEIALIQRWVDQGAAEGTPRQPPPQPEWTGGWQLGTPDLIVTMPKPFTLRAEGSDVFRTFVVRLPIQQVRYVRGLEFRPGNPRVVHHANIRIDRTPASRELEQKDSTPGYEGAMALSAQFPDGHFLAWGPGQVAPLLPKGMAWRLDPGTDLVFNLHLQPSGKPEVVQPSIGLFFTNDPPERTPTILRLARQDIDIPAGQADHIIEDSYTLPVDVEVHSVQPHAHTRARDVRGMATLPDGTTKPLIFIREWDFRWQHVYRYVTPFVLPRGTTISMRYTYDNSADNLRNPVQPPVRVNYGWQTGDEMAELYIQVLARDERDRATLERGFQSKSLAEDIVGLESLIRRDVRNAVLHDDVALLYLNLGRYDDAIAHLDASVRLDPGAAYTYFNLATALRLAGRLEEAIPQYQQALRINPGYAVAHDHLARVFLNLGRSDEALYHYRQAVRVAPRHAPAHNNLGLVLMQQGALDGAIARFRDALAIDGALADAHYNLGHALKRRGSNREALLHFQETARLAPDDAPALRSLAWMLATSPDDALRDASQAIRHAERAVAVTNRRDGETLDALAAAYAAAGQFVRALETIQEAIDLAPADPRAAPMRARRDLYQQQQPYREPSEVATGAP